MPRTQNFTEKELRCNCCGANLMDDEFLERLQTVRNKFGTAMYLNSGYRCPKHNARISALGSGDGPHTTGHAVDVKVSGHNALRLISIALDCGMQGVGIKQHGEYASRFVHLDDLTAGTAGIRPHIWSYT